MSFFYEIEPYVEQFMEGFADSGFGVGLFSNFWSSGLGIATYVLSSLGLYAMAKRRGIHNAWLSWVPVVNCWIIGCISDQYRYVVKGEVKNKRKTLLTLNIINAVLVVAMVVVLIFMIIAAARAGMGPSEEQMISALIGSLIGIIALALLMVGISIALQIVHYTATYDIYTSCLPKNNVLFLLLSIFFPVTEPFFLFFLRKKDEGMPPRRTEPQNIPQEPQYEPPQSADF